MCSHHQRWWPRKLNERETGRAPEWTWHWGAGSSLEDPWGPCSGRHPPWPFLPKSVVLIFMTCYLPSALPVFHPFNQGRPGLLTGAVHNGPRTPASPNLACAQQMVRVRCFLCHSEEGFQFLFFVFIRQDHPKWNLQAVISIYSLQNWSWNRA